MTTLQERLAEMFPEPRQRGLLADIAALCEVKAPSVTAWFNNAEKVGTISRDSAERLCKRYQLAVEPAWLAEGKLPKFASGATPSNPTTAPPAFQPEDSGTSDLVITQYDVGGAMGEGGFNLTDNPPGFIRSWRVTHEWLRLNVPSYTSIQNLAIVTGFGPSMKPMFNPGDPLLVDTGVKVINHEGVYFFRVGDEGFIKLIQRVPEFDGPGIILRVISKNEDFPPYDISPNNPHFEVLGKVLTVWRSEQY